jgi:hypothetical protein
MYSPSMLIVFAFFKLFFTSQLVPLISRPDSGQIAFKTEHFQHVPSTEVAKRGSRKVSLCPHAPSARQRKVFQPLTRVGDSRLRRSGKCDRDARAHWPVQRVVKITFFIEPDVPKQNEAILFGLPQIRFFNPKALPR